MYTFYLPTAESDRMVWITNFNEKLPSYATAFGITDEELVKVKKSKIGLPRNTEPFFVFKPPTGLKAPLEVKRKKISIKK